MRNVSVFFLLTFVMSMLALDTVRSGKLLSRMVNLRRISASSPIKQFSTGIQKTGVFISQLPEVYPSEIYFKKAMKKTREIKIDPTIKNLRNANRKLGAEVLDGLMKALTVPITNLLNIYKKEMKALHPYEVIMIPLWYLNVVHR